MEVTICARLITTPAAKAMAINGAAIQNAASSAWRRISTTASLVICGPQAKLFMSDPTTRFQPSTSTNNRILKGAEIMTGGNWTMPTDRVTEATTRSEERRVGKECRYRWSPYH